MPKRAILLILWGLILATVCGIVVAQPPRMLRAVSAALASSQGARIAWPPRPEAFPHTFHVDDGVHNCTRRMSGEHRPFTQCEGVDLRKSLKGTRIQYYPTPQGPKIANFRTTRASVHLGYIGIVIGHIPYIPNEHMWNAIWLMTESLPPQEYCEIDIFEMMGLWWERPKMSVHTDAGCGPYGSEEGLCGLYLNNCPEGDCQRPELANRVRHAKKYSDALNFSGHWTQKYNAFCAQNGPVTWTALVEPSRVLVGYALGSWRPSARPTAEEFVERCAFVVEFEDRVRVPGPMHLLVNSTYERDAGDLREAYWDILAVDHRP